MTHFGPLRRSAKHAPSKPRSLSSISTSSQPWPQILGSVTFCDASMPNRRGGVRFFLRRRDTQIGWWLGRYPSSTDPAAAVLQAWAMARLAWDRMGGRRPGSTSLCIRIRLPGGRRIQKEAEDRNSISTPHPPSHRITIFTQHQLTSPTLNASLPYPRPRGHPPPHRFRRRRRRPLPRHHRKLHLSIPRYQIRRLLRLSNHHLGPSLRPFRPRTRLLHPHPLYRSQRSSHKLLLHPHHRPRRCR
ncbi:hypothetical protein F5X68DRAFT_20500 [Plectosphaerella plurivora]|uniref:Uncharacterized protein n=1 Tax=Plectosphaerella plurivora TaxID=936078 RepID=A0A9P9A9T7_9PEZI|nr:hypothetical protein F5X68DRAFT_20500 [Plectosphaerella plurivora]